MRRKSRQAGSSRRFNKRSILGCCNLDIIGYQCIVNDFRGPGDKDGHFFHKHLLADDDLDAVFFKTGNHDTDAKIRIEDVAVVFVLVVQRGDGFRDQLADCVDVGAEIDDDGNPDELIGSALAQVREIVAEELVVVKIDGFPVRGLDFRILIADFRNPAPDSVDFDDVAYAHTSVHKLDTVHEVVDGIFQGNADAGRETAGDQSQGTYRNAQHDKGNDDVRHPDQHGDDAVVE